MSRLPRRAGARVLEVGCGTGIVARDLAAIPGVASAVGVDPSRQFIERARSLSRDDAALCFEVGDGTAQRRAPAGLVNATDLDGGFAAWTTAGLPVVSAAA